jgi:transmembrane sensor
MTLAAVDDIDDVAARWYSRARSGAMDAGQDAEMQAWLDADPAHQSAYDAIARAWGALDALRAHPRVLAMRDELPRERSRFMARPAVRRALAACLGAAVVGAALAGAWTTWRPSDEFADQAFRTGVGEKATITLPDGSVVTLNTGTTLRTRADPGRRLIYLDKGQAYFKVAKDRRHPFIVTAGGRTITAVGTAFDVRVDPKHFSITLVEGKVRVETPVPRAPAAKAVETTEMVAGSQLVATDAQKWSVARTDVVKATGWLRDQLVFEAEPLGDVAAEMNRYSVRKIVIADPAVAGTLVSGNFRPGDVEAFARAVEAYDYASISGQGGAEIKLSAP